LARFEKSGLRKRQASPFVIVFVIIQGSGLSAKVLRPANVFLQEKNGMLHPRRAQGRTRRQAV
jgi:hypothetical protein